jgi:hypothetical protein
MAVVVVVVVAEFGVSRGRAARARAGLKQAWRAGSGIVKPNCDGFGSGGGACIVAAGDACVVCRVCWFWWARSTVFVGRRASLQWAEREERARAMRTRRRCFAGRRRDEQADGGWSRLCSTVLLLCCYCWVLSCLAARLSLGPLSLHCDRCITSIPLSICLPLLLVLPVPAASTAHPLARPRPSSQHPAPHRPPSLATGD